MTYSIAPGSISYGTSATIDIQVDAASGQANPAGTITFTDNSVNITGCTNPANLVSTAGSYSEAKCTTTQLPIGTNSVTATYTSSDSVYANNSITLSTFNVSKATPTVTVAVTGLPAVVGYPVTLKATVDAVTNGADPTGTVTFKVNGSNVTGCAANPATLTAATNSSTASCTTTQLPQGSDTVTATYGGDGNYLGKTGTASSFTVSTPTPTGAITFSPVSPITYGTSDIITLTLTGTAATPTTPTGNVEFYVGTTPITGCTSVGLVASTSPTATATCTTSNTYLQTPSDDINWSYGGDSTYGSTSSASATTITVNSYPLTVTPSAESITYGSPVPSSSFYAFTITPFVSPDTATSTNYVAPTCTSSYTTTSPAGTPITITCSGGSATNYSFDDTATSTLTVYRAAQQALTVTSLVGYFGNPVTLTASGGSGTGALTFSLVSAGSAGCTLSGDVLSATSLGSCVVSATKAGDTNYTATTSPDATVQFMHITLPAVQATLTVSGGSGTGTVGTPLTLTSAGGTGSGSVTYTVVSAGSAGCTLSGDVLSATGAGTCTVSATKAGDSSYLPVTSATVTITFVAAPKQVTTKPAARAIRVVGVVHTGRRSVVTVLGRGFYGRPRVTSNARGTKVVVMHDTGTRLTIRVTTSSSTPRGAHVFTIRLANGTTLKVRYVQR